MPQSNSAASTRAILPHQLFLSAYSSCLFIWGEESRPLAWGLRDLVLYFWHPNAIALGRSDFLFFYLELFLIPAVALFIFLRLMGRFSPTNTIMRVLEGVVAVAGYPLVCLSRLHSVWPLFAVELTLATVCFALWASRKWLTSSAICILLLGLHFAMWSAVGAEFVDWKRASLIWDFAWAVWPVVGFAYSLLWASYFRRTVKVQASRA